MAVSNVGQIIISDLQQWPMSLAASPRTRRQGAARFESRFDLRSYLSAHGCHDHAGVYAFAYETIAPDYSLNWPVNFGPDGRMNLRMEKPR